MHSICFEGPTSSKSRLLLDHVASSTQQGWRQRQLPEEPFVPPAPARTIASAEREGHEGLPRLLSGRALHGVGRQELPEPRGLLAAAEELRPQQGQTQTAATGDTLGTGAWTVQQQGAGGQELPSLVPRAKV